MNAIFLKEYITGTFRSAFIMEFHLLHGFNYIPLIICPIYIPLCMYVHIIAKSDDRCGFAKSLGKHDNLRVTEKMLQDIK